MGLTREEAKALDKEYSRSLINFGMDLGNPLPSPIDKIYDDFEQQLSEYEKRLCDVARLASRVILIGEEEGWFEWKGDADKGGNHSSLHRDLTKVANQRVYKDFCDMHVKMINTLEQQLSNLKHNYEMQEIVIADYKKRIEQLELRLSLSDSALDEYKQQVASLEAPNTCDGCKYITANGCSHWSAYQEDCCNRYPNLKDYYEPKDKQ